MNNSAEGRLLILTNEVKAQLEGLLQARRESGQKIDFEWSSKVWNLKGIVYARNPNDNELNLNFFRLGKIHECAPLEPWLEDFAKTCLCYYLTEQRKGFNALDLILHALRWLNEAVRENHADGVHDLLPHHFSKIKHLLNATPYMNDTKYGIGTRLLKIVGFINRFALTNQGMKYINPYKPDRTWKKKDDRTATSPAMDALYHCINNPVDDNERILMEMLRLHVALGDRIGETHTLLHNSYFKGKGGCLVESNQQNSSKKISSSGYGLRYLREKAKGGVYTKPLEKNIYEIVKKSIEALDHLCAPARSRAKLLATMPGRFPLPKDPDGTKFYDVDEFVTSNYILNVIGFKNPLRWCENHGIPIYTKKQARALGWVPETGDVANVHSGGARLHLVADVERACLKYVSDLVVLRQPDGTPVVWLHDLLGVIAENQLIFGRHARIRTLFPSIIPTKKFYHELVPNAEGRTMFERRGITLPDGSPVRVRPHQTRHLRNRFLDEAGLSQIQQAHAMGRDPTQNEAYQGGSDINIIQQSHLARLAKTEQTQRASIVKDAVRAQLIEGGITRAYHHLRELSPVKAEEFLDDQVGQILITRFGACTNEWSGQACPKHNKCFKRCSHYHVTGTDSERNELEKELQIQRQHRAKVKELADEQVYRAETALHNLDHEIALIEEALAQWRRAAARRLELDGQAGRTSSIPISLQVYPDGVSHYKEVRRPQGEDKKRKGKGHESGVETVE